MTGYSRWLDESVQLYRVLFFPLLYLRGRILPLVSRRSARVRLKSRATNRQFQFLLVIELSLSNFFPDCSKPDSKNVNFAVRSRYLHYSSNSFSVFFLFIMAVIYCYSSSRSEAVLHLAVATIQWNLKFIPFFFFPRCFCSSQRSPSRNIEFYAGIFRSAERDSINNTLCE